VAQVAGALLPRASGPPVGDHQISDVIEAAGYPLLTGLLAAVVAAAVTGAALLWMQGAGREPAPSAGRPAG
jgi:hypothetical protein